MPADAQDGPVHYPTGIGTSDASSIHLLGHDLAGELMGNVGFGELALWLATQQRPTPQQVRVFEAVLVSLADHGFTPTAIAARLTLYSAPDALQGAIAAGLLGGGSRFLGVTEDTGRFLAGVLATVAGDLPTTDEQWDALARRRLQSSERLANLSQGWAILSIRRATRALRSSSHLPNVRACVARICACSRRLGACMPRYLAARCRSMARAWLARPWPTLDCRLNCCAAWPCSRGQRVCWGTLLKNCATPSRPLSTQLLIGTPSIGQT